MYSYGPLSALLLSGAAYVAADGLDNISIDPAKVYVVQSVNVINFISSTNSV